MSDTMTLSVGIQLRQARQERQLTMADVARDTKIQPWVLEALEADRLQDTMSPIYVKGFLSTYAKFLRLSPEGLLTQLRWPGAAPAAQPPASVPAAPPPAPITVPKLTVPKMALPKIRVPKVALPRLALPSVRLPKAAFLKFALPKLPAPRAELPTLRVPRTPRFEIPWPAVRRFGAAAAVVTAVVGLILLNPLQWLPDVTLPVPQLPRLASISMPKEHPALPELPAVSLAAAQPLELTVTAYRTTWIRVRADGKLLTQQRLQRGANEQWSAKKSFEIVVAKPSQVEVLLNGQSISPLAIAHRGRLAITHQGIAPLPEPAVQ
jgi:hypothetical protein